VASSEDLVEHGSQQPQARFRHGGFDIAEKAVRELLLVRQKHPRQRSREDHQREEGQHEVERQLSGPAKYMIRPDVAHQALA
jgi:hypothetical protein